MKLATLKDGTRDGLLIIVSGDNTQYVVAKVAKTLQEAMDNWKAVEPKLLAKYKELQDCTAKNIVKNFDVSLLHSPLPRAYEWIDGSAYINHVVLVRKARGAQPPETLKTDPLVYQGGSGTFLAPTQNIEHFSEDLGIDFESEVGVIVDDVPMGTTKNEAEKHIKLIVILNDVTLRNVIPKELEKGFGFFVSKPSTAFSPFAITPDELGDAWKDGRLHLPLISILNGKKFGDPEAGPDMWFSFHDLIEHLTKTRSLTAGTIIGSGTVSNEDVNRGSSCIAEKRMLEKIETGTMTTPFMKFGDTIQVEMFDKKGHSLFGQISQKVVQAKK
jgi:fumarylacetoacetate (FAA) hydrolase